MNQYVDEYLLKNKHQQSTQVSNNGFVGQIDTTTLKEIKYDTIRQQLHFINNTIQSHCIEKDGNLIYFYIQEVARKFARATDMNRLQLSSIVYDINLKKTVKSRWHNLTNVYFDFLNKQFYRLEK